jgi:hypothetical protein
MAVLHAEPTAPVISVPAVLRRSALRVDRAGVWADAKVAAADLMLLPGKEVVQFLTALFAGVYGMSL